MAKKPSRNPSVFDEPHLQQGFQVPDTAVDPPIGLNATPPVPAQIVAEDIDHTVWDEPVIGDAKAIGGKNAATYANWLAEKQDGFSESQSWLVTFGIALLAGPWAIATWFFSGGYAWQSADLILTCCFVPLLQELGKIAFPLWVVEKRPYWFKGWFQIYFCGMASATICVTAINLIMPFESEAQRIFSWTVFLTMHLVASFLSTIGLEKIWRIAIVERSRPKLENGYRWFMAAFLLNGFYSTAVWFYYRYIDFVDSMPKPQPW